MRPRNRPKVRPDARRREIVADDDKDPKLWRLSVEDLDPSLPWPEISATLRRAAEDGQLDEAMELFLLAWEPALVQLAFTLVHMRSLDPNTWAGDALSVVLFEAYAQARQIALSDLVVEHFHGFLHRVTTRRWDVFLDSTGGLDGRSGMVNGHRRRTRLANHRASYVQQTGAEPGDDQTLIDWANAEQAKTHNDPARSGMVFTLADLRPTDPVLSTDAEGGDQLAYVADIDAGPGPLAPLDRKRLATLVIERSSARDEILGKVAAAVYGEHTTDEPGPLPPTHDVATELRIAHRRAASLIEETRELARDILAAEFGITGA